MMFTSTPFSAKKIGVCCFVVFVFMGFLLWPKVARHPGKPLTSISCIIIDQQKEEMMNIRSCIDDFQNFRARNKDINRAEMETVRVKRHNYLTKNSHVLEVGGYTGEDAAKLIREYDPYYMAMEPVPKYYKILEDRYKDNPKFKLLKYGLGETNKTLYMNINTDATSLFRGKGPQGGARQEVHIRDIRGFFNELGVENNDLDLITINCEGCEYELLELLVSFDFLRYIKNIQFQFHLDLPGIENQECRYCQIMSLLARTHKPMFQYSYTWQAWTLK